MANMVKTNSYAGPTTILVAPELAFTIPVIVANTGITADSNGRKIIKAGTPITGDLLNRKTAFSKATETAGQSGTAGTTNAVGLLLHDLDVTDGNENGTLLVSGAVDILRVDTETAKLFTTTTIGALNRIIFVKGE